MEVTCDGDANYSCTKARLKLQGAPKGKNARGKDAVLARDTEVRVAAGKTDELSLKLTSRAGAEAIRRAQRDPADPDRGVHQGRPGRHNDDETHRQGRVELAPGNQA